MENKKWLHPQSQKANDILKNTEKFRPKPEAIKTIYTSLGT